MVCALTHCTCPRSSVRRRQRLTNAAGRPVVRGAGARRLRRRDGLYPALGISIGNRASGSAQHDTPQHKLSARTYANDGISFTRSGSHTRTEIFNYRRCRQSGRWRRLCPASRPNGMRPSVISIEVSGQSIDGRCINEDYVFDL